MITFFPAVGVMEESMFQQASNRHYWRFDEPGLEDRPETIPGESSAIEFVTARAGFHTASSRTTL